MKSIISLFLCCSICLFVCLFVVNVHWSVSTCFVHKLLVWNWLAHQTSLDGYSQSFQIILPFKMIWNDSGSFQTYFLGILFELVESFSDLLPFSWGRFAPGHRMVPEWLEQSHCFWKTTRWNPRVAVYTFLGELFVLTTSSSQTKRHQPGTKRDVPWIFAWRRSGNVIWWKESWASP